MKLLNGSIMSKDNFERLQKTKQYLEVIKAYKLELRDEKNVRRGPKPPSWALEHIGEELTELKEAFEKGDAKRILEEIADMINCAEILATMVYIEEGDSEIRLE